MTATLEQPAPATLWSSMPGWGIAADLIPPELINGRRLKVLRRLLAAGLLVLLVACAAGYYLSVRENSTASSELTTVQFETSQLQREGRSYAGIVTIQGAVSKVQTQIAGLMVGDVDLVGLTEKIQSSLPKTMTISQEAITVSTAGVAAAGAGGAAGVLDTSGLPRIGTITMGGTGQTLNDLSDYVDKLKLINGFVDVLPISNTAANTGKAGTTYSLTIGLTNAALSHRFDAPVKK